MTRILRIAPWSYAACAVLFGLFAAIGSGTVLDVAWRASVVVIAIGAALVSRRVNGLPWYFAVALVIVGFRLAVATTGTSAITVGELTWSQALSDLLVSLALTALLVHVLRSRRGGLSNREYLDGVTVVTGAALTTWIVLANPLHGDGVDLVLALVASSWLPVAVILLTLVVDLWVDGLAKNHAMWFLVGAATANLAGTMVRSMVQLGSVPEAARAGSTGLFVAAYLLLCAALTHRRITEVLEPIDEAAAHPHREMLRVAPIVASLSVPVLLMALVPPTSAGDMAVRGVASAILIASVVGRLYVAMDSSARAQKALIRRLRRDELTGLPNRTRFVELLSEMLDDTWRSNSWPTVIQINLDRFKYINDSLGHNDANKVLILVANRLSDAAREFGGVVARTGGDEFVIADGTTQSTSEATRRADAIRDVIGAPMTIAETPLFVTASIGVAVTPSNRTLSAEELIRRADIASHRAKNRGRSQIEVFDVSMHDHLARRMDVEHALHGAIGRQEMRLYHQPIVDITTGRISGFEALIRWQRTDDSLVPPSEFIPVAEETGIICELGAWALEEALTKLRGWIDEGLVPPSATTSVNVSPRQIADPNFADVVRSVLDRTGVPAHLLWVEITESMMLEEPDRARTTLRAIREMGVRIALDDFGTGYSSLSLLQQFPIQRIKIDRAFVQGIAENGNDRSLVRTIVAMAQSMNLDLVAEGVETVHQLQGLRELECDKAQGYLISHPVPSDAMRSTMAALDELADLSLFRNADKKPSTSTPSLPSPTQQAVPAIIGPIGGAGNRPIGQPMV